MPIRTEFHDSLPYIDRPPSPSSLAAAHGLIASSLDPNIILSPHPLLPDAPPNNFTHLIQSELDRIASASPISGIDLTRYEASPDNTADTTTLKAAYTNASYLTLRLQSLELLEQFGKNAWLLANSQLEEVLRQVEKEIVETKGMIEGVNRERKGVQERSRGVLEGAERGWREGVGGLVQVQVAVGEVEGLWRERLKAKGGG
ncbi:hypothetical protein MMC28_003701 [Mycoblastus sanguinarius]|nr:hypothetical protein [Mycoblastus sanguinarius]